MLPRGFLPLILPFADGTGLSVRMDVGMDVPFSVFRFFTTLADGSEPVMLVEFPFNCVISGLLSFFVDFASVSDVTSLSELLELSESLSELLELLESLSELLELDASLDFPAVIEVVTPGLEVDSFLAVIFDVEELLDEDESELESETDELESLLDSESESELSELDSLDRFFFCFRFRFPPFHDLL